MAGDDSTGSIIPEGLSEGESVAFWQGYNDYGTGLHKPVYDPPQEFEKAYTQGWQQRRQEDFEEQLRDWAGGG